MRLGKGTAVQVWWVCLNPAPATTCTLSGVCGSLSPSPGATQPPWVGAEQATPPGCSLAEWHRSFCNPPVALRSGYRLVFVGASAHRLPLLGACWVLQGVGTQFHLFLGRVLLSSLHVGGPFSCFQETLLTSCTSFASLSGPLPPTLCGACLCARRAAVSLREPPFFSPLAGAQWGHIVSLWTSAEGLGPATRDGAGCGREVPQPPLGKGSLPPGQLP